MADPNTATINAATDAVDAVNEIKTLESQLISPVTSVADQTANVAIHASLRVEKTRLNDANAILRANKVETVNLTTIKFNSTGLVIGPWTFSHLIENTSQYAIVESNPEPTPTSELNLTINDTQEIIKSLQKQYTALNTEIRNLKENEEDVTQKSEELTQIKDKITDLEDVINSLESSKLLNEDPRNNISKQNQNTRQDLENEVRSYRKQVADIATEIDALGILIENCKQDLSNLMVGSTEYVAKNMELDSAQDDLVDAQAEYKTTNSQLKLKESQLDDFLASKSASETKPTVASSTNTSTFLTENESKAVKRLHQQIIDRLNTSSTEEERINAYTDLSNLDSAITSENIERLAYETPPLDENTNIEEELNSLIGQRNTLLFELQETTDEGEIALIKSQLSDIEEERYQLSLTILGLQDVLNVGIKVRVIEDPDNLGTYILQSFDVSNASYQTDDVYSILNPDRLETDKITRGTLDDAQYEQLRFATGTDVYDMSKGRTISKSSAQTGQPDRYINIRPIIENVNEYIEAGQAEVEILQSLLATSDEAVAYQEGLTDELAPLIEVGEQINIDILENRKEIKDVLRGLGISEGTIADIIPSDPNDSINTEQLYLAIAESPYAQDEDN